MTAANDRTEFPAAPEAVVCDLAIVGGGPSGLAAALEASRRGIAAVLVEERSQLGGQIFKRVAEGFRVSDVDKMGKDYSTGSLLIKAVESTSTRFLLDTVACDISPGELVCVGAQGTTLVHCRKIILATGAYDRPVAFPGWTLPGVLTAGALQSLIKTQGVLPGRRILMAGSGPLVLAFSAQLHRWGANIVAVAEAAPFPRPSKLLRLTKSARADFRYLAQGARDVGYLTRHGIPLLYRHIILRAEGPTEVERAVLAKVDDQGRLVPGIRRSIEVDTICIGYGFFPSTELARLAGCQDTYAEQLGGFVPIRDRDMESSVPGIYVVGDGAGVLGSASAIEEGRLAAMTVSMKLNQESQARVRRRIRRVRRRLQHHERFQQAVAGIYPAAPAIDELATEETILCRCEDVTLGDLHVNHSQDLTDINAMKAITRAGMGPCQGRNCGRHLMVAVAKSSGGAVSEVSRFTPRAPVKPVSLGAVAVEHRYAGMDEELPIAPDTLAEPKPM